MLKFISHEKVNNLENLAQGLEKHYSFITKFLTKGLTDAFTINFT